MATTLHCPSCESGLTVANLQPGQRVRCPNCDHGWTPDATPLATKKAVKVLDAEEVRVTRRSGDRTRRPRREARRGVPGWAIGVIAGAAAVVLLTAAVTAWVVFLRPKPADPVAAPPRPADPEKPAAGPAADPTDARPAGFPRLKATARPTPERVAAQALRGLVFLAVLDPRGGGGVVATGSGCLVQAEKRWVLTSHQTAVKGTSVLAFFPDRAAAGRPNPDPRHYLNNRAALAVPGKVIERSQLTDLALVELDRVPPAAEPLTLAPRPAVVGTDVQWFGSTGVDAVTLAGDLWRQESGPVRHRAKESIRLPLVTLDASVLQTPTGKAVGDAGGPTVDETGRLTGMTSHVMALPGAGDPARWHIDADQIRDFLRRSAANASWTWPDAAVEDAFIPVRVQAGWAKAIRAGNTDERVAALIRLGELDELAAPFVPVILPWLDDGPPEVRAAAAAAVNRIGPPGAEDLPCLAHALTGPGEGGRLYALRMYTSHVKLPVEHRGEVIALLAAADPETRILAAGAVGNYGPEARATALDPLAKMAADVRPAVADAAAAALDKLGPYRGADFDWLSGRTTGRSPRLRRFVVTRIAADAASAEVAVRLLVPALADDDPAVRVAAADGLGRWGQAAAARLAPEPLLKLLADPDPVAQAAAARAAGRLAFQPAFATLRDLVNAGPTPEVKRAAAEALVALDLTSPTDGAAAVDLLLECDAPTARARVLEKLAATAAVTKERVPKVAKGLTSDNRAVQLAALTALKAAGPIAAGQTDAVAKLITDSNETLAGRAIDTLAALGPAAAEPLGKALDEPLPTTVKEQVCRAIGRLGQAAPKAALVYLLGAAEKDPFLREAAADALAEVSNDEAAAQLRACVAWSLVAKKRQSKHPIDFQLWAFRVIARLDPKRLSDRVRATLLDGLKTQSDVDPDARCRREAEVAHAKLSAAAKK